MASHNVPRADRQRQKTAEAQEQELKDIAEYRSLVEDVNRKVSEEDFSPELLQQTATLLNKNPEYYTMWNVRRQIYSHEFENLVQSTAREEITDASKYNQTLQIIGLDLQFLFPLLLKFPKCYWIWDHRIWLLEQSLTLLPTEQAKKIWEEELILVSKMLARDSRNYHGWGYRRFVVRNLETKNLRGRSMAKEEYDYTTKMIGSNLSNFSAWHNRANLTVQILNEKSASSSERRTMLDSEFELIHKALFDPYDQSLWFYHQTLMSTFDPDWSGRSMVPDLSSAECIKYLLREREFIEEILEDADDCKWAYQALVECLSVEGKLKGGLSPDSKADIKKGLQKLKNLDPLRAGRWLDMEAAMC